MQRVPPGPPSLHNPPDLLFKLQGKTKDVPSASTSRTAVNPADWLSILREYKPCEGRLVSCNAKLCTF